MVKGRSEGEEGGWIVSVGGKERRKEWGKNGGKHEGIGERKAKSEGRMDGKEAE